MRSGGVGRPSRLSVKTVFAVQSASSSIDGAMILLAFQTAIEDPEHLTKPKMPVLS